MQQNEDLQSPSSAFQLPLSTLTAGVTEDLYAQDPGLRSTELKHAARSAAHWRTHLEGPRADTEDLAFGRIAHLAVLEPTRFRQLAHVRPSFGKGEGSVKAAAKWRAELPAGAVVVSEKDLDALRCIYKSVHSHPQASRLLRGARIEHSLAWEDESFKMRCKARYDALTPDGEAVDLKTCRDASYEVFSKELVARGYTFSAAHYLEGLKQTGLGVHDQFFYIACEKTPPYAVAVYSLSQIALKRGRWWQRYALGNIEAARASGVFAAYSDTVQPLVEPGYAPLPPGYTKEQLYEDNNLER